MAGTTLDLDETETDALLYYDARKEKTPNQDEKRTKLKSTHTQWNERIGFKFNKFWLFRIGCRCGYSKIRTTTIAEICFGLWCLAVFSLCIYLVSTSIYFGYSNKLYIYENGFALHSGLLTGIFYAMVIFLSLRYPFYWKWGLFMIGFDRQMLFHRYCAYFAAITCIAHIVDNYQTIFTWKAITGWICYFFALLLLIFASNYFRRKHYNDIFLYSHWIFIIGFIVFGWLHNAILIIYGTFIILIDVILRFLDNQFRATKITNISMLDYDRVMKIEFEKKGFSYRAGQYVFVRFPDLGFFEFHPFSISSYPGQGKICSLHIKSSVGGKWTDKLAVYMKLNEGKKEWYKNIRVQIEGPFGELTLSKELYRYEHVVFIGGGIGITPLDSMFNQLVTDLFDGDIRRKAKTKCIDFIFTTRSRSLITEFASRNKAWQVIEKRDEERKESDRQRTWINPLVDITNVRLEEIESYHQSSMTRKILHGQMDLLSRSDCGRQKSLFLTEKDQRVGFNKSPKLKFYKDDTLNGNNDYDSYSDSETEILHVMENMAVETLDITNSTHITRVKDKSLRKYYKTAYPFINFDRPNIRGIIYAAASKTKSKNVCVITSGPKGMINDCIRWGAEIGVDVHYEVFDW
eukprot:343790_1